MTYITENTIDKYIDSFEDQDTYDNKLCQLLIDQKDLMAFISIDNQSLLTHEEAGLLEYITMIIYYSAKDQSPKNISIKGKDLEDAEEKNWEIFNSIPSSSYSKVIDKFFENYHQEDLLALVEDTLQPDEDQVISTVGREIILVTCKAIIDVLHEKL